MYTELSTGFGDHLACYRIGNGPREIILLHGLGATSGFWLPLISNLDKSKYRFTLFDIKGHGKSSFVNLSLRPSQIGLEIVNAIIQTGIKRYDIICHSFGGRIGLNILLNSDTPFLDKLFILDTYWPEFQARPTGNELQDKLNISFDLKQTDQTLTPSSIWQILVYNPSISKPRKSKRLSNAETWKRLVEDNNSRSNLDEEIDEHIDIESLKSLGDKLMMIYGEKSIFLPSGISSSKYLGISYELLLDSGHFFPRSHPESLATTIDKLY